MRISTSQIYSATLSQINSALIDVTELNLMNSSQKKINSPADDPAGMASIVNLRSYYRNLSNYADNCTTASDYLSLADTSLSQASEYVTSALEQAEQGSTGTYTTSELQSMATELRGYLESLLSVANTTMGDDYVFGGDDLDSSAFELGVGVTLTNDSLDSSDIVECTGELDSTISVRFTEDGVVGTDSLDYEYSLDGGETWTSASLASGATTLDFGDCQVTLASGASITASDGDGGGTEFLVRTAVYYTGSDEAMEVAVSDGVSVDMTSVGSEIFGGIDPDTGQAYSGDNLFEAICNCIAYLDVGDYEGAASCLDSITAGQEQLLAGASDVGARENKVTAIAESIESVQDVVDTSISNKEDADLTQILVELAQAEYVYEAVLSSTSEIMSMSLLDYL